MAWGDSGLTCGPRVGSDRGRLAHPDQIGDPIGDRAAGWREGERHDSGRHREGEREAELPAWHESQPFRWPLVHGRRLAVGVQAAVERGPTSRESQAATVEEQARSRSSLSSHRNAHLIERAPQP